MQLGQSRTLPVEKPEQIDLAQAARYFGARGTPDETTMALLERCAAPLLTAAAPRAVWHWPNRPQTPPKPNCVSGRHAREGI